MLQKLFMMQISNRYKEPEAVKSTFKAHNYCISYRIEQEDKVTDMKCYYSHLAFSRQKAQRCYNTLQCLHKKMK